MMEKDPPVLQRSSVEAAELRRGRHYRLEAGDGFYEILDAQSGEQVAVFSDGAFGAAWNRFVELEYERSISGLVSRGWRTALHRWDAAIGAAVALIAVAVLVLAAGGGIEPLKFLSSGDPEPTPAVDLALAPTGAHPDATPVPESVSGKEPRNKGGNDGGGGQNRGRQGDHGRVLVAGGPGGSNGGKEDTSSSASNNDTRSNEDPKPDPDPDPKPDPDPDPDPTIDPTTPPPVVNPPPDDDGDDDGDDDEPPFP